MLAELKSVGPYSLYRWAGDLLFVSGQLPINPHTGLLEEKFKNQCARSLSNIQAILEGEGLTLDDIVKLTVMVNDLEDFEVVNEVFEEVFNLPYPSRSTFQAARLPKDALIEIEAIAIKS